MRSRGQSSTSGTAEANCGSGGEGKSAKLDAIVSTSASSIYAQVCTHLCHVGIGQLLPQAQQCACDGVWRLEQRSRHLLPDRLDAALHRRDQLEE